jgi:hypothetical protein
METDNFLWWFTLVTGVGAAALSICATVLDRWLKARSKPGRGFALHIASYVLLSVSILGFIFRGLIVPT